MTRFRTNNITKVLNALNPSALTLTALVWCAALTGCDWSNPYGTSVGALRAVSLGDDPVTVRGDFTTAVYSDQLTNETSFYVTDLSVDVIYEQSFDTGQVLRIELLWEPKPGKTPLDKSATNVSLRYVIFADGEIGVYEGGGFALVNTIALTDRVTVSILDASLRLGPATPGFNDLLGPTRITGTFTADRDPQTTHRLHVLLSQRVTDELGTSTLVRNDVLTDCDAMTHLVLHNY